MSLFLPPICTNDSVLLTALSFMLEKSSNHPLSLAISTITGHAQEWTLGFLASLKPLLIQALVRTKDLEIQLEIFKSITIEFPLHLPLLQHFTLTERRKVVDATILSRSVQSTRMLIQHASSLTSIAMNSLAALVIGSFPPFESTKAVECIYSPADHLRPLRNLFPSLAHLHLRVKHTPMFGSLSRSMPFVFPHLNTLTIEDETGIPDIEYLIDSFTIPSVVHFAFITPNSSDADHHIGKVIVECLRRSGCRLQTLRISAHFTPLGSDPHWISEIIDLAPELRVLEIEFCALKDRDAMASVNMMPNTVVYRLFSLLSYFDSPTPTLPSLSAVTLHIHNFSTDELWIAIARDMTTRFLSMVEYRVDEGISLCHAALIVTPNSLKDDHSSVEEVQAEPEDDLIRRRFQALGGIAGLTCVLNVPGLRGL
ncbi:hypothetical protein PM082_012617 [Marasmius tenuissimus]|nr:hypothetical protein PM082_012617 [Marasmius tenuissimus]